MVVLEGAINNIMGGMENTAGVRLHSHRHKLKQRFDIVKKLGQGTYGKVQLAINKETGQEVAIKTIKKAKIETEQDLVRIRREIQIMSSVQHPQIIHIYEVFENREKMVLVMEYAAGGELYDYLSERKVLPEPEARRVFRQVASAVYYCHKHKICHRDLKLENILLDLDGNAKIADFGLSNVFAEKQRLDTFCGSPLYASPEIVKGIPYVGPEVDCWSLGVLLYTLVYGAMPFDGSNFRRLVKQITQGDFYEPSSPATASELIRHMLTVDSAERASIEDICNHWWVNEGYADSCLAEAEALASLTPVRLDLLLSLAPKQISSEHMLIQPDEEDVSQKSEGERAPPDLKLPPPPTVPPEEESTNGVVPMRSHSLGAVSPPGGVNVDLLVERKRKEKKDPSTKKGPGRPPPAGEEEKKRAERGKKREASSDGEKRKSSAKRRESSLTRKTPSASTEDEEVEKKGPPSEVAFPGKVEGSSEVKALPKEAPMTDKETPLKDAPPKKTEAPDDTAVEDKDTEAILKETAAKIEAVEDLMKTENEEVKGEPSPPMTSPQATSSVVSVASSQAASPTRSRAESESSTDAVRTPRSESSSRRQSKIFSKAALFDPALAAHTPKSPPSPADRGPSKRVTRLGALNMTDLAKKFEEKPSSNTDKKGKIAAPFKVSDTKKAFESSSDGKAVSESPKRKASVGSSSGDSGIATPREPTTVATLPAKDEKPTSSPPTCPVKSTAGKTSREASPIKVSKSSSKDSSVLGAPAKKKERSPPVAPPSQAKSSKKEASPVKQISKAPSVAKEDKPPPSASKATKAEPKSVPVPSPSKDSVPSGRRPKETSEPSVQKDSTRRDQDTPLDSSDSESEAEKMLRELSVKREKLEMAKKEKLKKVSEGKDLSPVSTEEDIQSGVRLPSSTASSASSTQDVNDHKYATLPRGFRAKPEQPKMNKPKIPTGDELDGRSVSQEETTLTTSKYPGLTRRPSQTVEVILCNPDRVLSPTPCTPQNEGKTFSSTSIPKMNSFDESTASSDNLRKKSQMEIVLNNRQTPSKRSSFAEIHISPAPSPKGEEKSKGEFRTEAQHNVAPAAGGALPEPHLQRARRERIIPIMLEDDLSNGGGISEDSRRPPPPTKAPSLSSSVSSLPRSSGGLGAVTIPTTVTALSAAEQKNQTTASPEPIRKSRRERIIPIAVEGEGFVTPPVPEATNMDKVRPPFQRQGSSQGSFSRGRGFTVDRTESFSSAGEDDDDEDGFQILTAESLFSTLLARVRSLTRKMATDEGGRSVGPGGGERTRRLPPSSANSSQSAGFWSSLYSPPREIPGSRKVSETSSRRHSRDDDPFESFGPPLWGRSASRDTSESESVFSEPSTFSTLPRGWRTRRSGREESVVEGDESLGSFTPSRRQFYSRTLSRDNPSLNTEGEDTKMSGNRNSWDASSSTGTLPRSGQAVGPTLPTTKFSQEPASGVAPLYENFSQNRFIPSSATLDSAGSRDKPSSSSSSGEAKGRVGGHCEQQSNNNAAHLVSSTTRKNVEDVPKRNKQSMQQLQDLVKELESIPDDDASDPSKKPKVKVELRMTSPIGGEKGNIDRVGLAGPNPSKSLSSFQKQRAANDASSSNPNIVYNVTLSHLNENEDQRPSDSTSKSQSSLKSTCEKMKQPTSFLKDIPTGSLDENANRDPNESTIKNKYRQNSEEKTSKNIFIPYDPNLNPNTSSHKNLYADKRIGLTKDKSPLPNSNTEIKKDKVSSNSTHLPSNTLSLSGKSEKCESPGSKIGLQSDNSKHLLNLKQPFSRLNEENKKHSSTRDSKTSVATELYSKGGSQDLGIVSNLANAPDSCTKEGTGKGTLKGYRRTKSREVTPAIEAVTEKIAQFNSSTLKRISPFEAYRRSKSRELGSTIESVNSGTSDGRMKSPPPSEIVPKSSDAGMSQFEKAKYSIEKKFEKARSPPLETELAKPPSSDSKEFLKLPLSSASVTDIPKEREKVAAKEKNPVKENEKAKSMYKILTSKFTRSLSNVGEEKFDLSKNTAKDIEDELKEREDRVWQKRPSRFLKSKMEKSASRTSFYDIDDMKEEEEDKNEKKSTKFSNALNKFLGRKHTNEDASTKKVFPTKSTSAAIITEKFKRPPRFSSRNFSKSQENLNPKDGNEARNITPDTRAQSVFPEEIKSDDVTIESATKDIRNHLSQLELNIPSRRGDVPPYVVTPPPITESIHTVPTTCSIPSPGSGDGGLLFTTNRGGSRNQHQASTKCTQLLLPDYDSATWKRSIGEFSEDGSITPTTESGNESIQSPLEDFKEMEDESVMDRITRKSYYSRFNEMKRKPKPKRIDTKEAMDQQLAEAKARLLHEELQPKRKSIIRDSMSPTSVTPKATSPSFPVEGIVRKNSRTNLNYRPNSLSPEDGTSYYSASVRRAMGGHSPRVDESLKSIRYNSSDDKDDTSALYRSMSDSNHEGKIPYRKNTSASSCNANELTNYQRSSSARTRDDPSMHLRQPSMPREDSSPFRFPSSRRSSIAKDEIQSFRRLSSTNLDDSNLGLRRLSSVPRDDFDYKSLSSSTSRENNPGYHTLQYRKPSKEHSSFSRYNSAGITSSRDSLALPPTRKSPSVSPSKTLNQRNLNNAERGDAYGKSELWESVAFAAGKAAGEAAAAVVPEISRDDSRPTLPKSAAEAAAVKSAREELSRRLTPLTRLSSMGHSRNNESSSNTRPYRKNATTDCLPFRQCDAETTSTVERPPYKRTSTIDLPPTDSRIRTTDYRKVLQDPARKFTGIRSFTNGSNSVKLLTNHRCSPTYSPACGLPSCYSPPSMNTLLRRGSYR